jgi:hypothetical protein
MSENITFENKISAPFTWVENDLIRSKSLSFEAMGLYLMLRSFGGTSYPSVDYLCSLGRTGRDKLWRIINELIQAKLLLRKQEHMSGGKFSRTLYRILSLNDNYEEIYKEFMGEEPLNQQTIDNAESQPCTEKPCTAKPYTENPLLIRIIKEEESLKTHTQEISDIPSVKSVCEDEKLKNKSHTPPLLKAFELFKNEDEHVLAMIERRYKDTAAAAKYLDYQAKKGKIAVKNPCALLIKTLKDGLYSDIDEIIKDENHKIINEKQKIISGIQKRQKEEEEDRLIEKYIADMPDSEKQKRIKEIISRNNYKDDEMGNFLAILKLKTEIKPILINSS